MNLTKWIPLVMILVACSPSTKAQEGVERINSSQLFEMLESSNNLQLIDVRTPEEVANGRISGALHVDFYDEQFLLKMDELDKNQPLVVYCAAGGRSASASSKLMSLGFKKIYDLSDGARGWDAKGYPLVKE